MPSGYGILAAESAIIVEPEAASVIRSSAVVVFHGNPGAPPPVSSTECNNRNIEFTGLLDDQNAWVTSDNNPAFGWSQVRCRRNEKK
jgi:hypothetical protein